MVSRNVASATRPTPESSKILMALEKKSELV